jgi:hypothetical protein
MMSFRFCNRRDFFEELHPGDKVFHGPRPANTIGVMKDTPAVDQPQLALDFIGGQFGHTAFAGNTSSLAQFIGRLWSAHCST